MHGRTATKELDAGRYLRLARAGIGSVAIDLPNHGERLHERSSDLRFVLDSIERAEQELDDVFQAIGRHGGFDLSRAAIGGMSMGGMIALVRLCRPHPFKGALLEATSGSWAGQLGRQFQDPDTVAAIDPSKHLAQWREIPVLAIHAKHDEWVKWDGQHAFLEALRKQYTTPDIVEELVFEKTGAPHEHLGFGNNANEARMRGIDFLQLIFAQ
jgi:dienelactone hydrolase